MKNLALLLFIVLIIGAGIGYALYRDPELPSLQLFDQILKEFASNADELDKQFKLNRTFTPFNKTLYLNYFDQSKKPLKLSVNMLVSNKMVTLTIADGEWPLSSQSIILEPFIKDDEVLWKCINGSVLTRYRDKKCRLGYGLSLSEFK